MALSLPARATLSLFFTITCFLSTSSLAAASFRPKALVLPVVKDAATLQYTTVLHQRTPLVAVPLVLDLGGQFLWVDCDSGYTSSTFRPARCRSAQCSLAGASDCGGGCPAPPRPGCFNDTCGLTPENSVTRTATSGQLGSDVVSVPSTDGSTPGRNATVDNLPFVCAPSFLLDGLAAGTLGMAGLGRARVGLPSLFASAFSFARRFAICLSSSTSPNFPGVAFFGPGPYSLLPPPGTDFSTSLTYTPLLLNPVSTASAYSQGDPSTEYFIGVKSITIGTTSVPINSSLLKIDSTGTGGTKISTVNPYTILETSIYTSFLQIYESEAAARNISKVAAVKPFGLCFSTAGMSVTRVGYSVPYITLNLQGQNSPGWTITGSNSIVEVSDGVVCLGFVDGGGGARTSIVIGGFQLEDNLVEFDLARGRLGFSETLLGRRTTCSNFNFTSSV